jgi:hypothetical protein
MNKTTEALKLAELVEASAEEYMGEDGMVMVIPLDLYNDLIRALAAIREALADHSGDVNEMVTEPAIPEWVDVDDYEEPVKQEPVMDYERLTALREGEQNRAEDDYFNARPHNDTPTLREMFCQGFERGFRKGLKYAAPVEPVKQEPVRLQFPTMLRKMWSGTEVQQWLDEQVQPVKQEPVAKFLEENLIVETERVDNTGHRVLEIREEELFRLMPLYAAPVKRQWVDLTDDEINKLIQAWHKSDDGLFDYASAVITAFKEKNK